MVDDCPLTYILTGRLPHVSQPIGCNTSRRHSLPQRKIRGNSMVQNSRNHVSQPMTRNRSCAASCETFSTTGKPPESALVACQSEPMKPIGGTKTFSSLRTARWLLHRPQTLRIIRRTTPRTRSSLHCRRKAAF